MPPATSADRTSGNVTNRNVWRCVGAEVGRRLQQVGRRATQPGDDVVVRDDHAERGVSDDERVESETDPEVEQAEVDPAVERVLQGDAGDDAGQRDGQDHQERDGVPAEELEALHGEGPHCAQHERDDRCDGGDLHRAPQRLAGPSVFHDSRHQSSVQPLRRPRHGVGFVEPRRATTSIGMYRNARVIAVTRPRTHLERREIPIAHTLSNAPRRFMASRYATMMRRGHSVYAAASG